MSDPADAITAAVYTAFDDYPKESDPGWRSPNWIMPEACTHAPDVWSLVSDHAGAGNELAIEIV
jgi:hypothetical protein